jgi:hypothetical protein
MLHCPVRITLSSTGPGRVLRWTFWRCVCCLLGAEQCAVVGAKTLFSHPIGALHDSREVHLLCVAAGVMCYLCPFDCPLLANNYSCEIQLCVDPAQQLTIAISYLVTFGADCPFPPSMLIDYDAPKTALRAMLGRGDVTTSSFGFSCSFCGCSMC